MKISNLSFAPELLLPKHTLISRIERDRYPHKRVRSGPVRVPIPGIFVGRFDLRAVCVGYFADNAEAAIYETLARREVTGIPLARLEAAILLTIRLSQRLHFLDLRPYASSFPVLQSLRYKETQELAEDVSVAGYDGIVYRSAQQFGADCYAVFEPKLASLRRVSQERLVDATSGAFHCALAIALRGSCIPVF